MAKVTPKPGVILADAVYSLDELKDRTGLGTAALRTARRQGMPVHRVGRLAFVLGKDFLEFVGSQPTTA